MPNQDLSKTKHALEEHLTIKIYPYEQEGIIKASAMPELKLDSIMMPYSRRFEYLIINVSQIHLPEFADKRKEIWSLYPDTIALSQLYAAEYLQDEKLNAYFETTFAAINDSNYQVSMNFTEEELMEVASKFFYCDKVFSDTSIQSHVCIGLNGVAEAKWERDYTLLEAFCYEGIFNDLMKDTSELDAVYSIQKKQACAKYKPTLRNLDQYLLDVRSDLFGRMKEEPVLKALLLDYYRVNSSNLAFRISE